MSSTSQRRYVLLPQEGAVASDGPEAELLSSLPQVRSTEEPTIAPLEGAEGHDVQFVDSTHENGPRLVETTADAAAAVNNAPTPLRLLPEIEYPLPYQPLQAAPAAGATGGPAPVSVTCVDAKTGAGVGGAHVVAFTDFARKLGGAGTTDAAGKATVPLGGSTSIDRLFAYPPLSGYWGAFQQGLTVSGPLTVSLTPIDVSYTDSVRHYYSESKFNAAGGVQVGVIDTGAGPHTALNVVSGVNTVTGEPRAEFKDARGHGTHVSGLIGSNGTPPLGLRGLAPGVPLHAYRVFPADHERGASNYSILKAMIFAANDRCDIVNLSLGGGPPDQVVEEAVIDARNAGMLVMVSAGNDDRSGVGYPAAYPYATAVAAMGREGTFPDGSLEHGDVLRPPRATDPAEFIASFSNIGSQLATAAPGVGALSTIPGNLFGAMSGTSMASPVACGAVACLLSRAPQVFGMNRDAARSEAIAELLSESCVPLNFGPEFEGAGIPDPAKV